MEDRISMATKRQITLRFKDEYAKASKKDKGVILDRMRETLNVLLQFFLSNFCTIFPQYGLPVSSRNCTI